MTYAPIQGKCPVCHQDMVDTVNAAFQAGAASRDAEVQRLQMALADTEALEIAAGEKIDQLRAQTNALREALQFLIATKELKESVGKTPEYEQMRIIAWGKATVAITSTPEQSLAEYRNKVIEDCAKQCEAPNEYGFHRTGYESAEAIRAMKEQP